MDENIWLDLTLGSVLRAEGSDWANGVAVRAATSPTDARALQILMALLKGNVEMWEVHGVANAALAACKDGTDAAQ